ncbi:MAG TPA: hypothetical protein ENG78_03185, partial [Acidiferrobacteraceae bacterium]|nr:hypothetical protein [Acidiferrobacteraceae bacterium]HEX19807.1 hypothetical protein [Acidiferrobacteraceae bacterium]
MSEAKIKQIVQARSVPDLDLGTNFFQERRGNDIFSIDFLDVGRHHELEIDREKTVTSSPVQDEESNRDFFSIGYRVDFWLLFLPVIQVFSRFFVPRP